MAVYLDDPNRILAGSDHGIYRSEDRGTLWGKLWSPMEGMPIWSIAIDPEDTQTIFVGIKPAARAGASCRCRCPKPIPRWDVHFGEIDDDRKDSTAPHITFRPQLGGHR